MSAAERISSLDAVRGVALLGILPMNALFFAVRVIGVWTLQLWRSTWWLDRYRYGPFEWAWRCGTYRTRQPLRRLASVRASV